MTIYTGHITTDARKYHSPDFDSFNQLEAWMSTTTFALIHEDAMIRAWGYEIRENTRGRMLQCLN